MKFLIIDKDEQSNNKLCKMLSEYGGKSECDSVFDYEKGLEVGIANKYDAIILLNSEIASNTKKLIVHLRQASEVPFIVLVKKFDTAEKIEMLNNGADGYLSYDCSKEELFAVIGAVLRRYYRDFGSNIYEFKNLKVNFFEKSVKIDGVNMPIVAKMYDLLEHLIRHKEIIIAKTTLFNRVWGFESETSFSVVEVYVSKIRKMLEASGLSSHLLTIKNAGYCWTEKEKTN